MNWRGWIVWVGILLTVVGVVGLAVGGSIADYNWEKSVESRIEVASAFSVDIVDVRRDGDVFVLIQHIHSEMTEKVQEAYSDAEHEVVEEAGKGTSVIMYVRPNRDRSRWYAYTIVTCPTALYLERNFNACTLDAPLWSEMRTKNTRWAN